MNSIFNIPQLLQQAPVGGNAQFISTIAMFGLIFLIFYFLIIRPQNKRQKETKSMLATLKKGDKVQTIGGIRGSIVSVKEESVIVKVDDSCNMEFVRSAISNVIKPEDKSQEKTSAKAEEKTPKAIEEKPSSKPAGKTRAKSTRKTQKVEK